jgi:hypothetical protein
MDYKKSLLISLVIILTGSALSGQYKNKFLVNLGVSHIMHQDIIFSPFIHKTFSFPIAGLEYTRDAKLFNKFKIRYSSFTPSLVNSYEFIVDGEQKTAESHYFTFIDLDYQIGKKQISGNFALTYGGLFSSDIQALNFVYGRVSSFGYHATFGAGVFGNFNYSPGDRSKLSVGFQLPLVFWHARSPYLVNDDNYIENISSHSGFKSFIAFIGDGNLVTLNKVQSFDLEAKYTYDLKKGWGIGASYMFEFIHASASRNLLSFRNSIVFSTYVKF